MRAVRRWMCLCLVSLACASVGKTFPTHLVPSLEPGVTTQAQVAGMLGQPWRTGVDNGQVTWTYARYTWNPFKGFQATDLVVRFDEHGVVTSYTYSTTSR